MALSLKSTGIATNLVMCLAVDDDGTTIKEFVSADVNSNKTLGTGVASGVSTSTWKGTSRGYFPTLANGSFGYFGVQFAASHRPSLAASSASGFSFFAAAAGAGNTAGSSKRAIIEHLTSGTMLCGRASSAGPLQDSFGTHNATTSFPSDNTTKFSLGYSHVKGTSFNFYYGLESGSLAADGNGADTGFGSDGDVFGVGGATGQGNQPGKWHAVCLFNKELSLAEFQSLHGDGTNDWFTTLFNTGGVGGGTTQQQLMMLGVGV